MTQQEKQETRRQNLEQERGGRAWENVKEVKGKDKNVQKEYRSIARGLNSMVQINGLGQTLGFFKAKGKNDSAKAHSLLLKHLTAWMSVPAHFSTDEDNRIPTENERDGLLAWIVNPQTSSADYRRATAECLAFGLWLRRFAEAELEGDENERTL